MKPKFLIFAILLGVSRFDDVRANRGCSELSMPRGVVRCTNAFVHGSRCAFACDDDYELLRDSGTIACNNGVWMKKGSVELFDFASVRCVAAGLGRSFSADERCSRGRCEGAYPGITAAACRNFNGCCWNEQDNTCNKIQRARCGYRGIPKERCLLKGCIYDQGESTCYERTEEEVLALISRQGLSRTLTESTCTPRYRLPHSRINCASRDDVNYRCDISCDEGFFLVGDSSYICNNGNLDNFTLDWECRETTCPSIDADFLSYRHNASGATVNCTDSWKPGSVCSLSCPANHRRRGTVSLSCQDDGRWSEGRFACRENPKCKKLKSLWPRLGSDGKLSWRCSKREYVGSKCSFRCAEGFRVHGSDSIRCGSNMKWNRKPPRCAEKPMEARSGCNYEVDVSIEGSTPDTSNNAVARLIEPISERQSFKNMCDRTGLIEIDVTTLANLTLNLRYSTPKGPHVQIGVNGFPSFIKGYLRFWLKNNNFRQFQPLFAAGSNVIVTFNTSERSVTLQRKGASKTTLKIPGNGALTTVYVHLNKWGGARSHRGSGLCSVCVSYARKSFV